MKNINKTTLYYVLAAVVLVIIIGMMFWSVKKDTSGLAGNLDQNADQSITIPTEDVSTGSVNVTKKVPSISYADALVKYASSRIQLNDKCQAIPNNVTYKNNTSIMIDNRSAVTRTIKIGSNYSVKGYGFKIIKLSSYTLPIQFLMDCDQSENVATILLQR